VTGYRYHVALIEEFEGRLRTQRKTETWDGNVRYHFGGPGFAGTQTIHFRLFTFTASLAFFIDTKRRYPLELNC
jgi:hypothetical protein